VTLQQLSYFLEAARRGSFSAAADALHLAQPSLSEQVRRLEGELGVALFVRGGRTLALTEAGRTLRTHAERVVGAAAEAAESVASVRRIERGTAAMGMFGNAPRALVSDVLAEFRRHHPEVCVHVVGQNSSEVADAVRDGGLEAALVVLPIDDRGLQVRPLSQDEIRYVSADPKRLRRPVTIEALASVPLILYDARWGSYDPSRRRLAARAQNAGLTLEPAIEVEDVDAALELAARGLGDTVLSQAIGHGRRLPEPLGVTSFDPPLYETFAFVTRRGARPSPATRELLRLTGERLAALTAAG
jgi:DNA-binding transcriptional LysR family regulator